MTRILLAFSFVVGTLIACGGANEPTGASTCTAEECGPEPPIAPTACPPNKKISSVCERGSDGKCGRHVNCD